MFNCLKLFCTFQIINYSPTNVMTTTRPPFNCNLIIRKLNAMNINCPRFAQRLHLITVGR